MALELVGDGGQAAAIGAAVSATICAVIGKFLLPKYLEAREKFEEETKVGLAATHEARETLEKTLGERIQGVRDHVDSEFKLMRESWHLNNNYINKTLGDVAGQTARNAADIRDLIEDNRGLHETIHKIDKTASGLEGTMQGMTTALEALTAAVNRKNQ